MASVDVLVIGGGLAGAAAALTAREAGASVLLCSRAPGATALSSGAADVAAIGDLPLREAVRELARRPGHPYALLDDSALERGLAVLRALGYHGNGQRNVWLLSPLGCVKPAALAQPAIAAGDLRALPRDARPGVVSFCGAQAVQAPLLVKGLQRFFPQALLVASKLFSTRADALRAVPELAAELDRPGRRAELGAELQQSAATHLFLPTLGFAEGARAELEAAAGKPVYELLSGPPSVPGLRLQRAIDHALRAAGVQVRAGIVEGAPALQLISGSSCEPLEASAVVLATGRFIGGGIRATPGLRETVFGLPAFAGERSSIIPLATEELFARSPGGSHAGMRAGLRVGPGLRVPGASLPLFAAGSVIGGYDFSRDEGGLGAAAILGSAAGLNAAQAARLPARASA